MHAYVKRMYSNIQAVAYRFPEHDEAYLCIDR